MTQTIRPTCPPLVAHQKFWQVNEAGVDGSERSRSFTIDDERDILLAQDEFRQRQIEHENEVAEAGLSILSKHPAWSDIQAKGCALNATALKRPFSGDIHLERKSAFEVFNKKARLYLRTVSDTETADAYCAILPLLARSAFWECRLGQPPQYCQPLSAEALSFEREVAERVELAKMRAYKKASKSKNKDESKVGLNKQPGERQKPVRRAAPRKRDWPEGLSKDDPNYELSRRFYLEAWADSHGLVADTLAGQVSFPEWVESCIRTFAQGAKTQVEFIDNESVEEKCRELDRAAEAFIHLFSTRLRAASKGRGRAIFESAIEHLTLSVKQIAARSKQQIFQNALKGTAPPNAQDDIPTGGSRSPGLIAQFPKDRIESQTPEVEKFAAAAKNKGDLDSGKSAKIARANTVAKVINELNVLKPQMFDDEAEYDRLRSQYPDFLAFKIADGRSDLKLKILGSGGSARHIRLAQEIAGAYHGRSLGTIRDHWKDHKPKEFRRQK